MERIKALCRLILCASILVFITTFVDAIYPQGVSKPEAYTVLIEQYQKILDNSSIEEKDAKNFISEADFSAHIDRNIVKEKAYATLENTELYRIGLDDNQRQEISEQFALLYEQQITAQENAEASTLLQQVRLLCIALSLLSAAIIGTIYLKDKNTKRINPKSEVDKKVEEKIEPESKKEEKVEETTQPEVKSEEIKEEKPVEKEDGK